VWAWGVGLDACLAYCLCLWPACVSDAISRALFLCASRALSPSLSLAHVCVVLCCVCVCVCVRVCVCVCVCGQDHQKFLTCQVARWEVCMVKQLQRICKGRLALARAVVSVCDASALTANCKHQSSESTVVWCH
jgi:hypothetical protein